LVALAVAFAFRLFASIPAPEIIVRVGEDRLEGAPVAYCWPPGTDLKCDRHDAESIKTQRIAAEGTMRFLVYPVPPNEGRVTIRDAETGESILTSNWTERLAYELPVGRYTIYARADYPEDAYVRYVFAVTTTRSGS
jgi:hypothetical protein